MSSKYIHEKNTQDLDNADITYELVIYIRPKKLLLKVMTPCYVHPTPEERVVCHGIEELGDGQAVSVLPENVESDIILARCGAEIPNSYGSIVNAIKTFCGQHVFFNIVLC